jgi:hypothetical protein
MFKFHCTEPQVGEGSLRQVRHTDRPKGSYSRARADEVDEDTSDEDFDDPTYGQEVVGEFPNV